MGYKIPVSQRNPTHVYCRKCGRDLGQRTVFGHNYEYCEKHCPHDQDYDQHDGGINECHGCGKTWRSYD